MFCAYHLSTEIEIFALLSLLFLCAFFPIYYAWKCSRLNWASILPWWQYAKGCDHIPQSRIPHTTPWPPSQEPWLPRVHSYKGWRARGRTSSLPGSHDFPIWSELEVIILQPWRKAFTSRGIASTELLLHLSRSPWADFCQFGCLF